MDYPTFSYENPMGASYKGDDTKEPVDYIGKSAEYGYAIPSRITDKEVQRRWYEKSKKIAEIKDAFAGSAYGETLDSIYKYAKDKNLVTFDHIKSAMAKDENFKLLTESVHDATLLNDVQKVRALEYDLSTMRTISLRDKFNKTVSKINSEFTKRMQNGR